MRIGAVLSGRRAGRVRATTPLVALGAGVAMVAAACGGGGASSSSGKTTTTQAASTPSSTGAPQASSGGGQITGVETEYHITLSQTHVAAGTYTFTAEDRGQASHDLVVNGPGVSNKGTSIIGPGQSAQVTVTLQAGSYDVYCSVPGHKQSGMDTKLAVS